MPSTREVVITGIGVVSPIGVGLAPFWDSLSTGRSGIRHITGFPVGHMPITFGGEITEFDAKQHVTPRKSLKVMSREIQMAVAAANMAVRHAEMTTSSVAPERIGVVFGAEMMHSPPDEVEQAYRQCVVESRFDMRRWGPTAMREIFPLWMLKYLPNMPACHIGIAHDARGPNNTITLAEVSGLLAMCEAKRVIERGWADVMIAGGVGCWITPIGFGRTLHGEVSRRNDAPERAARPFDAERDGRVSGEGAAAFVLECRAAAEQRRACVLAQFKGVANSFQSPGLGPSGRAGALRRAIRGALTESGWTAADLGHVNAHGACTIEGDRSEAAAIRAELGDVPVTAPASYFGSLGAGSGTVELAASLVGFAHDAVPATLNYERADPLCPVNVIHGEMLHGAPRRALALNYTQHGQAVAVAVSGPDD